MSCAAPARRARPRGGERRASRRDARAATSRLAHEALGRHGPDIPALGTPERRPTARTSKDPRQDGFGGGVRADFQTAAPHLPGSR